MARPPRLRELEKRYKELRKEFLPSHFSKTGSYSDAQYRFAAAFRLLFHSELEGYLEALASTLLAGIDVRVRSGQQCKGAGAILCLYKSETRSEEHTSELQSLMRNSYAVFCLKKKNTIMK